MEFNTKAYASCGAMRIDDDDEFNTRFSHFLNCKPLELSILSCDVTCHTTQQNMKNITSLKYKNCYILISSFLK